MSVISLPPIGKKIKLTRELSTNCLSTLKDGATILKKIGMLIGNYSLTLDPGTIIRIEGTTSRIEDKTFGSVKISIFPEEEKMAQCYIDFSAIDGLSWDLCDVEDSPEKKIITRVSVECDYSFSEAFNQNRIWNEIFLETVYDFDTKEVFLNPLKLSTTDNSKFSVKVEKTKFITAYVKIGKDEYHYTFSAEIDSHFSVHVKPGLTIGTFENKEYALRSGGYLRKDFIQIDFNSDMLTMNKDQTKDFIKTKLKEFHKI